MLKKRFIPASLSALLLASSLAIAEEGTATDESGAAGGETPPSGQMMMGAPGMMGEGMMGDQQAESQGDQPASAGYSMGPGIRT